MSKRTRRRVKGRAVLALTTHPAYDVRRVRTGTSTRTMRRRFRGERRFRRGRNTWYLVRGKHARVLFKTRGRQGARGRRGQPAPDPFTQGRAPFPARVLAVP